MHCQCVENPVLCSAAMTERDGVTVTSVLGRAHLEMALLCLGSLRRYAPWAVRFVLHDDGSLGEEDVARLEAGLAPVRVVGRREADERMAPLLADRPACRGLRATNPLGLKLLDAALLGDGDLRFSDTDVLFLRPFTGLLERPAGVRGVFMEDRVSAYSLRSWDLLRAPRLRLPRRVNTGLLAFDRAAYDLDRVEWFLSRPGHHRTPVWVEQTTWALLLGDAPARAWDPRLVRFPSETPETDRDAVALHFISPLRDRLEARRDAPDRSGEPPVAVGTVPSRPESLPSLAWVEGRRRLRRLLGF
jgi:hypothetical protein